MSQHQTKIANLLREIVAYCREAGHEWSNLAEAEAALTTAQAKQSETFDQWLHRVQPAGCVSDMKRGWDACAAAQAQQAGEVVAYITTAADGQIICRHKGRWPHDQWVNNGWRPLTYADTSPPPAQPAPDRAGLALLLRNLQHRHDVTRDQQIMLSHAADILTAQPAPVVPAQDVISALNAWKAAWIKVPTFADRVNKATREAITMSHGPLFTLFDQAQRALTATPTPPAQAAGDVVRDAGPVGDWTLSSDEERFHGQFATREEALSEAAACGYRFIGRVRHPRDFISDEMIGSDIRERVSEILGDEVGEVAECFTMTADQERDLGKMVLDWIESQAWASTKAIDRSRNGKGARNRSKR